MKSPIDRAAITTRVCELAAEQAGVEPPQVTPATHFVNDLNFDSLDVVEFAMSIEDEFRISVSDDEAQNVPTVDAAVELVVRAVGDQSQAA